MVANGVQNVRVAFNWAAAEPYASWNEISPADRDEYTNVNGKPFLFSRTDTVVRDAAQRGVASCPRFSTRRPGMRARTGRTDRVPDALGPLRRLPHRPDQALRPSRDLLEPNPGVPRLPIRSWQIWNEPNLGYYWPQPFASSYVGLLRSAHAAIRKADPGAKVVLGALTNFAWQALGKVYRIHGAASLFDEASVNGFTKLPKNVILYLQYMRDAMDHFGDRRKPLLATEVSWPSAQGKSRQGFAFDTTEAGQARNIASLLPMIGRDYRRLGLAGFDYYTWMGDESDPSLAFNYAGLLRYDNNRVTVKPALAAFRRGALALEGCRSKGALATICHH